MKKPVVCFFKKIAAFNQIERFKINRRHAFDVVVRPVVKAADFRTRNVDFLQNTEFFNSPACWDFVKNSKNSTKYAARFSRVIKGLTKLGLVSAKHFSIDATARVTVSFVSSKFITYYPSFLALGPA